MPLKEEKKKKGKKPQPYSNHHPTASNHHKIPAQSSEVQVSSPPVKSKQRLCTSTVLGLWLPALTRGLRGQGKMIRVFCTTEEKGVDLHTDTVKRWSD